MKVALTGGGTLGHVIPALAVAAALKKEAEETELLYIGSCKENERRRVEAEGIPFHAIPTGKLRRYFSIQNLLDIFRILKGVLSSYRILKREKPDVLFSKGGYVSVPVVISAHLLHIPSVTHESDRSLGLANRINSRFCNKVCLGFDTIKGEKFIYTGNPVREEFFTAEAIPHERPLILVLGGSQGAVEINNLIYHNLDFLLSFCDVVHQAGAHGDFSLVKSGYKQVEFIGDELPSLMKSADLVISRSGAGAIGELLASNALMLLVPLGGKASRGDQIENAAYLEAEGAAVVLKEREEFPFIVRRLLEDDKLKSSLLMSGRRLLKRDAAKQIASVILKEGRS